jgi:seryl-tRNA synthetase
MLQLNYIREEKEKAIQKLAKKGFDASSMLSKVISLDNDRKKTQLNLDDMLAQSNQITKEIGKLFKKGEVEKANAAKAQTTTLKEETKSLQEKQAKINQALQDLLVQIPNIPHDSVPEGKHAEDNQLVSEN